MIELNRHIEILLLENECVIVPDFGGFMTHKVPARYDADDRSFLPPLRTLGFNPQLRINDSVLVQSYVEAYDISYPEAIRRVDEEVKELKHILSEEGSYTLTDLGTLTVNAEGNYEFSPCEAGLLTPDLYGLGAYTFKQLKDAKTVEEPLKAIPPIAHEIRLTEQTAVEESGQATVEEPQQPTLLEFTGNTEQHDADIIHIRVSWIRNTIAIAAAIVAFFFMSTPVVNSDLGTRTMSHIQNNILYRLMPKDTNTIPAEPVATPVAKANADSLAQAKETEKTVSTKCYCIVVASQVKLSNAESYVENLHKRGYEDAKVFIHNNVVRVTCGEYETESEAYRHLNRLNSKEEFYDAWVYKKAAI